MPGAPAAAASSSPCARFTPTPLGAPGSFLGLSLLAQSEEHPAVPWSLSVQSPGAASGSCGWNSRGREGADQEASCADADVSVYLSRAGAGTRLSCLLPWAFPWFLGASLLKPFPPPMGPLLGVPPPLSHSSFSSPLPSPTSLFCENLSTAAALRLSCTKGPPFTRTACALAGLAPLVLVASLEVRLPSQRAPADNTC